MPARRSRTAPAPSATTPTATDATNNGVAATALTARFAAAMAGLGLVVPPRLALALSGGGDSVALMHLLGNWSADGGGSHTGPSRHALIVDHGLRAGSASDAKRAAQWARRAGWRAHIFQWTGEKPSANIEDAARVARYALLGQWCVAHKVPQFFVAHTQDDLAENFLIRLGRGSGVDGLSAMRPRAPLPLLGFESVDILRPLLDIERGTLRAYLAAIGAPWLDDPMNEDSAFARVRVRRLLPELEKAGITRKRIADAARHLSRAREALEAQAQALLTACAKSLQSGAVVFDPAAIRSAPREIAYRALSELLRRVAGTGYRPRFDRLQALYGALDEAAAGTRFRARTLHGCRIGSAPKRHQAFGPGTMEINREAARNPRERKTPPK